MIRHDMLYSVAELKKVILAVDRFQNNFNFDCNTVIAERVTKDYGRTTMRTCGEYFLKYSAE